MNLQVVVIFNADSNRCLAVCFLQQLLESCFHEVVKSDNVYRIVSFGLGVSCPRKQRARAQQSGRCVGE